MNAEPSIWVEIALVVGFWTVALLVLLLPLAYLAGRLDRSPKDGPRCRRCGYDLRATTGEHCAECGAALSPRGVWPPGKPSRRQLFWATALFSWAVVSLIMTGMIWYQRDGYTAVADVTLMSDLAFLQQPGSGAFDHAWISAAGRGWQYFNQEHSVQTRELSITLVAQQGDIAMCSFDPDTLEPTESIDRYIQGVTAVLNGSSTPKPQLSVADILIDGAKRNAGFTGDEAKLRKELQVLLDFAVALGKDKTLSYSNHISETAFRDLSSALGVDQIYQSAVQDHYIDNDIRFLPDWVQFTPPVAGLLAWVAGLITLRWLLYKRSAVCGIPADAALQPV